MRRKSRRPTKVAWLHLRLEAADLAALRAAAAKNGARMSDLARQAIKTQLTAAIGG